MLVCIYQEMRTCSNIAGVAVQEVIDRSRYRLIKTESAFFFTLICSVIPKDLLSELSLHAYIYLLHADTKAVIPVLQIRRGNRDNVRIIFHVCP